MTGCSMAHRATVEELTVTAVLSKEWFAADRRRLPMVLLQGRVGVAPLRSVLRHGGDARGHQAEEPGDEETDDVLWRKHATHRGPS